MKELELTASKLDKWLTIHGMELTESCWQFVRSGCKNQTIFDFQLVIDQVPWQGEAEILISFVEGAKLKSAGYDLVESSDSDTADEEIYVIGLVIESIINFPRRLQRPAKWLTPHIRKPKYSINIEKPTIRDLDAAWETLTSIAPLAYDTLKRVSLEFEQQVLKITS